MHTLEEELPRIVERVNRIFNENLNTTPILKSLRDMGLTNIQEIKYEYILTKDEEIKLFEVLRERRLDCLKTNLLRRKHSSSDAEIIIKNNFNIFDADIQKTFQIELDRSNKLKHYEIEEREERKRKEDAVKEEIRRIDEDWNAEKMFMFLKENAERRINPHTGEPIKLIFKKETVYHKIIKILIYYLSGDKRFESELGFSFNKGLLLRGNVGLGKSFIPEMLADNPKKPIKIISMIDVANEIKKTGEYSISMGERKILALDDVGTERTETKHFGNEINWLKDFIETTDRNNPNFFKNIIISTNLNFEGLRMAYGFRVEDRLHLRFNIIDLVGDSLRKLKK